VCKQSNAFGREFYPRHRGLGWIGMAGMGNPGTGAGGGNQITSLALRATGIHSNNHRGLSMTGEFEILISRGCAIQKKDGANIHPPADISPVRASMHRKDRRGGDRIWF